MRSTLRIIALLAVLAGIGGFMWLEFFPWREPVATAASLRRETIWIEAGEQRHMFQVEIADTERAREVGLMFRDSLADNAGMLFIYPQSKEIAMWMENTYVSLDMLFLTPDGTIHHIARDAEPLSRATIASRGAVKAVLELKAGTAARLDLRPGMRVRATALGNTG